MLNPALLDLTLFSPPSIKLKYFQWTPRFNSGFVISLAFGRTGGGQRNRWPVKKFGGEKLYRHTHTVHTKKRWNRRNKKNRGASNVTAKYRKWRYRGKKLTGIQVRYDAKKEKKMARNSSRFDPGKAFLFFGKCGCAENAEWGVRDGPKFGSSQHERFFFAFDYSKGF